MTIASSACRQIAAHGEVEDRLAELLDLVGARGEGLECVEREAGVILKGGGSRRARLAADSRSRAASRPARAASSRSHRAISSSTLATMRCYSARGGRGKAMAATILPETSLNVVPGALASISGANAFIAVAMKREQSAMWERST